MKVELLSREELFNSVFTTEYFPVTGTNVERLWKFFSEYNLRRYNENYSRESFDLLINENRFNCGKITFLSSNKNATSNR